MLAKDITTKWLNFALEAHLETSPFQAKVEASNSGKKRGDSVGQDGPLERNTNILY